MQLRFEDPSLSNFPGPFGQSTFAANYARSIHVQPPSNYEFASYLEAQLAHGTGMTKTATCRAISKVASRLATERSIQPE